MGAGERQSRNPPAHWYELNPVSDSVQPHALSTPNTRTSFSSTKLCPKKSAQTTHRISLSVQIHISECTV